MNLKWKAEVGGGWHPGAQGFDLNVLEEANNQNCMPNTANSSEEKVRVIPLKMMNGPFLT